MILSTKAYAKINLYLDITGIRDNGYHNIKSIMQTVDLYDEVTVETLETGTDTTHIELTCSDPAVPLGEKNIAYKAAIAFFREAEIISFDCRIHIEKHIPMEAGLAGGSTDAAAVLRLLNKMYGEPFDTNKLYDIGAKLGADVPFCIHGGTCLCEGIGNILTHLSPIPDCFIVVARGGDGVSTPTAYRLLDELYNRDFTKSGGEFGKITSALESGDINMIANYMYNIFEDVILSKHEIASYLRRVMSDHVAAGTIMSGSGPSVFGIFTSKNAAMAAANEVAKYSLAFVCSPVREYYI